MERTAGDHDPLSEILVSAVASAEGSVVRVQARPGPAASGVALAPDLVLTAEHAVHAPDDAELRVGLPDGEETEARVVGRDPATDLALLRLDGGGLTPARAGDRDPTPGALGLLVARPSHSVMTSFGMISGVAGPVRSAHRGVLERLIYVDAVMYPGFSGGALIDTSGAVLGMATSGLSMGGPATAIPWDYAARIAKLLQEQGRVQRGYLGVKTQPIHLGAAARERAGGLSRGLLVVEVEEGGPAANGGVLQGDIIHRLDGNPVPAVDQMQGEMFNRRIDAPFPPPFPGPSGPSPDEDVFFHRQVPPPEAGMGQRRDVLFLRHMAPHMAPFPPPDVRILYRAESRGYADDLQALLGPELVGSSVQLSVLRGGQLHDLHVTVAARPGA